MKNSGGQYNAFSADFGNMQDAILPLALLGAAYLFLKNKTNTDPTPAIIGGGYSGGYAVGTGAAAVGAGTGAAVVGAVDGATGIGADLIAAGINQAVGGRVATGQAIIQNLKNLSNPTTAPLTMVTTNLEPVKNAASAYVQAVVDKKIDAVLSQGVYSSGSPSGYNALSPKLDQSGTPAYVDLLKSKGGSTSQQLQALAKVAVVENPVTSKASNAVTTVSSNKYVASVVKTEKAVLKTVLSGTGLTGSGTVKASSVVTAIKKVDNAVNKFVKVLNH